MKPLNIEAFEDLMEEYRKITIKDIKAHWDKYMENHPEYSVHYTGCAARYTAHKLTGNGSFTTCPLCTEAQELKDEHPGDYRFCNFCVWTASQDQHETLACADTYRETYGAIKRASSPEMLLKAFRDRADEMEKALKRVKITYDEKANPDKEI